MGQSKTNVTRCACGTVGPVRGAPALAAGWHGHRSRKGPTVWICPACVQARQLEAWRIADAERERRRLARLKVEAAEPTEAEIEASRARHEEARAQAEPRREAEGGAPRRRLNPAMLGMMAMLALGGPR